MLSPIDWNWDVKGISVIDIDKNCEDCIHRKGKGNCSKKFLPNEFFCLYFEVKLESAKKFPKITIENLENSSIFNFGELITYFVSRFEEKHYTASSLNRETDKGKRIEELLDKLLLLKGKGSSSEAREIRKELRKRSFNLRRK